MDTTLKEKLDRINEIKAEKELYNQLFVIFESIFAERETLQKHRDFPAFNVDKNRVESNISKGFAYVDSEFFNLIKKPAEAYLKKIVEIISKNTDKNASDIEDKLIKDSNLFQKFLMGDFEIEAVDIGIDVNLVSFLSRQCRRAFLEILRQEYTPLYEDSKYNGSTCPVCGSLPFLEEIRGENGKRYTFCPDCGMEWGLKRIMCPFCRCTDHDKLGYFSAETEPFYMVSFCNACKYYIKRLDFRENEKIVVPEVEHVATLHLDIVAKNEGYKTRDGFVNFIIGQGSI